MTAPERVSLRMEGGVKTTELSSVPNRLLLGVSANQLQMMTCLLLYYNPILTKG